MGDGRVHDYNDLPIITAGNLGGAVKTGRHCPFEKKVPLAILCLNVPEAAGIRSKRFADSTGKPKLA